MNGVRQGGILSPYFFNIYINSVLNDIAKLSIGCRLGIKSCNIIAYADDIVLLSPSLIALQHIIDIFYMHITELNLKINVNKSFCIKFFNKGKPFTGNNCIKIGENFLTFYTEAKYLGYSLQNNLCNKNDIIRERNQFYRQFNSILRKFHFASIEVKLKLINTYCFQFYGCCFWTSLDKCKNIFNQFAIAYHKSIKRVLGVSNMESNHYVCYATGFLTFDHYINLNIFKFIKRIFTGTCSFIGKCLYFLHNYSNILGETNSILKSKYDVNSSVLENDIDAISSRLRYVFKEEFL